jgi:hypothetical protein
MLIKEPTKKQVEVGNTRDHEAITTVYYCHDRDPWINMGVGQCYPGKRQEIWNPFFVNRVAHMSHISPILASVSELGTVEDTGT